MDFELTTNNAAKEGPALSIADIYSTLKDSRDILPCEQDEELLQRARDYDRHFTALDQNRDQYLSARELNDSLTNFTLSKEAIHFVMSCRRQFNSVAKVHDDANQSGIGRTDLGKLINLARSYRAIEAQEGVTAQRFDEVDKDKNGKWSRSEIDQAKSDASLSFGTRTLLSNTLENYEWISGYSKDQSGLTFDQLKKHYEGDLLIAAAFARGLPLDFRMAGRPATDKDGRRIPLYANTLPPLSSIVPDICLQPDVAGGNCKFVASMKSMASVNPAAIERMIRDNGNDTYTVTFPGARDRPVTVTTVTNRDLTLQLSYFRPDSLWPYVLQKAYGRLNSPDDPNDYKGASEGTPNDHALAVFAEGNRTTNHWLPVTSLDGLAKKLEETLQSGRPVFAGTPPGGPNERPTAFTRQHAYGVLAIERDRTDPDNSQVTIQSTYGELDKAKGYEHLGDGRYRLSIRDFNKEFRRVVCAEAPRPRNSLYNWMDCTDERNDFFEALITSIGAAAAFKGALTMRKTGAVGLGAWSASELVRDGLTAYRAEDSSVRWKYAAGAAADAVMLGGFGSRLLPSNKYGLAVAGAGFVSRWAIEKFM